MNKKLDKLTVKYKDAKHYVEREGGFTLYELKLGKVRAFGIAKCNWQCDEFDPERGMEIAYYRALKKLDTALKIEAKRASKKAK